MATASPSQDAADAHERAKRARAHYAPAEPRALGTMAILAALAILWVVVPIGVGVLLGTLLAFTAYEWYRPLARKTRKPALVAASFAAGTTLLVAGSLGTLLVVLVLQGVGVAAAVPHLVQPRGAATQLIEHLSKPLGALKVDPEHVLGKLRDAAGRLAEYAAGFAAEGLALFFDSLLALFFMAFTMYVVLRQWERLAKRAESLLPINPHHTRRLMRELRRIGRTVVIGNFGTGVIQGACAGLGYLVAGVPQPAFWGAITAVASLIPAVGTILVWVPAGLVLIAQGKLAGATFELAWGTLVVCAFCDYWVRPHLVGRGETMGTWMTFASLFGGIKLFGFVGLLLGPLLAGVALVVLKLYERARRFRLDLP